MRGLDAYLMREPPEPVMEPHAPWVVTFVTREGDYCGPDPDERELAMGGTWGVEHGGDTDGDTYTAVGSREQAEEAARRCNARYAYVRERDRREPHGECRVCGDFHEHEAWMDHAEEF